MTIRGRLSLVLLLSTACSGGEDVSFGISTLPDGRIGEAYDATLSALGGTPPYVFTVVDGSLPQGIELAPAGKLSGLAGTPGHQEVTFRVTDADDATADAKIEIYIIPDPLTIETSRLAMAKEGEAYDEPLTASGGVPPYTWTLSGGALVAGVSIVDQGFAGTPTEFGNFEFTVAIEDAEGAARTADLTLFVVSAIPMVTTTAIPKGRVGAQYDTTIEATGGTPPYTYDLAGGALPMGLTINNEGKVSGVPEENGDFMFVVSVTDSALESADMGFTIAVVAPLGVVTTALPQIVAGRGIDFQMEASGGEPPYSWSVDGALPTGVTFDDGHIVGMSTDVGDYPLTIRVTDSEGFRKSGLFTLRVSDRYTYEVSPALDFPPVCTGTTVSYTSAEIEVADSFAIEDVNVTVDIDFNGSNQNTRIVLVSPTGFPIVLCGDGVYRGRGNPGRVPGGIFCGGNDGFDKTYDDQAGQNGRPELPLARLAGLNAKGTWRVLVGVSAPSCSNTGTINRIEISIRDDRSAEDYLVVGGWTPNNRLGEPWLRLSGGGVAEQELFLTATLYSAGPNGVREGGQGDDVADLTPLTWQWGDWTGRDARDASVTSDGHVTTGANTGSGTLIVSGGGFSAVVPIHVTPPSWSNVSRVY